MMKSLLSKILISLAVLALPLQAAVTKGGVHSKTVFFHDVDEGIYTRMTGLTHSFTNGGIYTNGVTTNQYRIGATNRLGRFPTSFVHTVIFTGDTNSTNVVILHWDNSDGANRYVPQFGTNNPGGGITFTNYSFVVPLTTNFNDTGTNWSNFTAFETDYLTIPAPSFPWLGASIVDPLFATSAVHDAQIIGIYATQSVHGVNIGAILDTQTVLSVNSAALLDTQNLQRVSIAAITDTNGQQDTALVAITDTNGQQDTALIAIALTNGQQDAGLAAGAVTSALHDVSIAASIETNALMIASNLAQEARLDSQAQTIDNNELRITIAEKNIILGRFIDAAARVDGINNIAITHIDVDNLNLQLSTNWAFDSSQLHLTNTAAANSVLFSTNFPQLFDPTNATLMFLRSDLSPFITNDVDFIASVSKDNGVTFFSVPLSNDIIFASGIFNFTNQALHYLLDDNAASTVLLDALGNTNATLVGGNTTDKTATGKILSGIQLDGTEDFLDMAEIQAFEGPTNTVNFSLAFWLKMDSTFSAVRTLFTYSANDDISGNDDLYFLQRSAVTFGWAYGLGGEPLVQVNMDDLAFHHYVFTYDNQTVRVYVDGILKDKQNRVGLDFGGAENLLFGDNLNLGGSGFMTGIYDDIRIYERPIASSEVVTLFNSRNGTQAELGSFPTLSVSGSAVLFGSGTNIVVKVQTANSNNVQLKATAIILE